MLSDPLVRRACAVALAALLIAPAVATAKQVVTDPAGDAAAQGQALPDAATRQLDLLGLDVDHANVSGETEIAFTLQVENLSRSRLAALATVDETWTATFRDDDGTLYRFDVTTPSGLLVPEDRRAGSLDLVDLAVDGDDVGYDAEEHEVAIRPEADAIRWTMGYVPQHGEAGDWSLRGDALQDFAANVSLGDVEVDRAPDAGTAGSFEAGGQLPKLSLSANGTSATLTPGGQAVYGITVENTAEAGDYALRADVRRNWTWDVDPSWVHLDENETVDANLTVHAPDDAATGNRSVTFEVQDAQGNDRGELGLVAEVVEDAEDNVTEYDPGWPAVTDARIRPGGPILGGICTAAFVLSNPDNTTLYVATASHCVGGMSIGQSANVGGIWGAGVLAYCSWGTMHGTDRCPDEDEVEGVPVNDLALIRIDDAHRDEVHPAMRGYGGPTSRADPADVDAGAKVLTYGESSLRPFDVANAREGYVVSSTSKTSDVYFLPSSVPGDSGSPVVLGDGRALGVLSTIQYAPATGSNGIANLHHGIDYLEDNTSLDVELKTWQEPGGALLPGA